MRLLSLAGVVTLASYRRSEWCEEKLQCPWHALVAARDTIYAPTWATACLSQAQLWLRVDDTHHLHETNEDVMRFVRRSLVALGFQSTES